jgi:hypothetical protein
MLYNQPRFRSPYAPDFGAMPMPEEEDYLGGGDASMPAPPVPASAPAVAPKPPSALDRMGQVAAKRPSLGDPALKPRPIERILGALAGGAIGFGEGYINSGPRGRVVQPGMGAAIADGIVNRRYRRANSEWQTDMEKAQDAAKIESAQTKDARDTEYHGARMASEKSQQAYADAARERAMQPPAPRPVTPPKEQPSEAFERRKKEATALGYKEGTPEWQRYVGEGKTHYEPPKSTRPDRVSVRSGDGSTVVYERQEDGKYKSVLEGSAKPTAPAKPRTPTPGQQASTNAKKRADELIQQHGGVDGAIENAKTESIDVQNALNDAKSRSSRANGGSKKGGDRVQDLLDRLNKNKPKNNPPKPDAPKPAAPKVQQGQRVKLRSGETVTVKKVNPDGTFEY